jgi:hypothetical protein
MELEEVLKSLLQERTLRQKQWQGTEKESMIEAALGGFRN